MRRTYTFCGIGGLIALVAITAVCHGYPEPASETTAPACCPSRESSCPMPCCDMAVKSPCCDKSASPVYGHGPVTAPYPSFRQPMPVSQSIASPCCPTPATKGVAQCYPVNTTATVPGCCNPKAPKTAAPCCCIGTGTLTFTTAVAPPAKQPSLEDLLEKLEALEAKQAALDEEVKATRALVSLKFKAVVEKVNKLGASNPTTVIGERHPDYRRYVVPPAKHDVSVTPPGVTP